MSDETGAAPGETYDASNIKVLEGLEAVKKRPGMYIGDTDDGTGLHHMVFEIIDNAVDEALAGHCRNIGIVLNPGNSVTVSDDGRGIPVDMHAKGRPAIEIILTSLHSGGKFDQNSYKVSGGLHGVGAAVVNALSSRMEVTVFRDGREHFIAFENGEVAEELRVVSDGRRKTGTIVTFTPSIHVFSRIDMTASRIEARIQQLAFLNSGISFTFQDTRVRGSEPVRYCYDGGIAAMLKHIDRARTAIIERPIVAIGERTVEIKRKSTDPVSGAEVDVVDRTPTIEIEVAFEWTDSPAQATITAFTNNIPQRDYGTHVTGFRTAITKVMGVYAQANKPKKFSDLSLEPDDFSEGLSAVVSVKMPDPKFSSQTKDKLVSSEVTAVVTAVVGETLHTWLEETPAFARKVLEKAVEAALTRERVRKAREVNRKNPFDALDTLPGKLSDCSERDPAKCEIFLVEGDSAGGSAKGGRDRKTQAILPLKGKILNVERVRQDKILESKEIATLVDALDVRGIGDSIDLKRLRYHKIIIMTDADVDGAHIRTLIETFFYRQMKAIIENGHLFIAQPPLFSVEHKRSPGKKTYLLDQEALDAYLLKAACDASTLTTADGTVYQGDELLDIATESRGLARLIDSIDEEIGLRALTECLAVTGAWHPSVFEADETKLQAAEYICSLMGGVIGSQARLPGTFWSADVVPEGIRFSWRQKGVVKKVLVAATVAERSAVHDLLRHLEQMERFYVAGSTLATGARERVVRSPCELFEALCERGSDGIDVKRYKGLGEMNPEQLWDTTLNPQTRSLLQVKILDEGQAEEACTVCMGEDVPPRRLFIETRALEAQNVDA